jgi:glutamine synthetase
LNTIFLLQSVGAEIEFCLVDAKTEDPIDHSVFANSVTLNDQESLIDNLYEYLKQQYIPVELIHAESGPGQLEVVLEYSSDPMVMADNIVLCRETIRAVARKHNLKAIFTPKYDLATAGNGMHLHFSTRNASTNQPNFCRGSALTLQQGESFVEGLLAHLPAVMGLTLPTVNSFRRIGPGCWTGSTVGWALEDKECGVRVCSNLATQEWDHVELKLIDHTCNIYLAMAGILHSGMKGIESKLSLRKPLGEDLEPPPSSSLPDPFPASVSEALNALEGDDCLMSLMGPELGKGYLVLRRHEVERASKMNFSEEVNEFLSRA